MHDNAIAAIPPNVADLTNLTTLTLSNNQVWLSLLCASLWLMTAFSHRSCLLYPKACAN